MMSPTQLTLRYLREQGYYAEVTEKWNAFARIRQDLLGFIDVIGIRPKEILGVQTTSASNASARIRKITELATYPLWKKAGGLVVVHGWAKKNDRWELTKEEWI